MRPDFRGGEVVREWPLEGFLEELIAEFQSSTGRVQIGVGGGRWLWAEGLHGKAPGVW